MKKAIRILAIVYLIIGILNFVTFIAVGAGFLATARSVAEQYIARNPSATQSQVDGIYYGQIGAGIVFLASSVSFIGTIVVSIVTRKYIKEDSRCSLGASIALAVVNTIFGAPATGALCLIDGLIAHNSQSEDPLIQ